MLQTSLNCPERMASVSLCLRDLKYAGPCSHFLKYEPKRMQGEGFSGSLRLFSVKVESETNIQVFKCSFLFVLHLIGETPEGSIPVLAICVIFSGFQSFSTEYIVVFLQLF